MSNLIICKQRKELGRHLEPKIIETIQHLFGFYGDDAGWSDESLRKMGVEPLPRPEPTA